MLLLIQFSDLTEEKLPKTLRTLSHQLNDIGLPLCQRLNTIPSSPGFYSII